ncbi:hypothetical protein PACTADRAFT_401 [Pachysolen tannophilus NRRL Y-2460]|uniref:RNase MRP protein 1 RNA binding domain-containing protein n=1 Tax=Pachysolen tannophilus NRRL Y-2460 TaxID=669874 RepID=A0A1E4U1Y9_PACTA|nr:hypothetical protein PACTADRAFT_401 [Pachysolen tannophilus NRRL Y-2460]
MSLEGPIFSDVQIKSLTNEYEILFLLYHRNKNQHKSSKWFKYLNILVRYLRKLLLLLLPKTRGKNLKERQLGIVKYLLRYIIPDSYSAFYSILNLGQFITSGFALIGCLSKIYGILIEVKDNSKENISKIGIRQEILDFAVNRQDIGEEIVATKFEIDDNDNNDNDINKLEKMVMEQEKGMDFIDEVFGKNKTEKKKQKKKKKDKTTKQKKRSVIDDIFG